MNNPENLLQKHDLFTGFSPLEKKAVQEFLIPLALKQDQILFRQGEPGSAIYIVKKGVIGSYIRLPDEKQMEIGRFSAGQSFGEMAIIEGLPRTMTCYAVYDTELRMLEAIDFYRFVWEHPMIGLKMLKNMTRNMVCWLYESNNFLNILVRWGENARLRAITDGLTGLYKKHYLEESVAFSMAKYKQSYKKFCFLMFDVDHFHQINTRWGHEGGDELLKHLAQLLTYSFSENVVLAKLGGDEFAGLLNDCPAAAALSKAERFFTVLKKEHPNLKIKNQPLDFALTVSIGIAEYPTHGDSLAELQAAADKALYRAKEAGRNNAQMAPPVLKKISGTG